MTTFLNLAKQVRQESEIAGTGPTAVTSQTGQLKRVVDWAINAWKDIQLRHPNWRFMRHSFTVNTVASDDTYASADCTDSTTATAIARFSRWWVDDLEDRPKCYLSSGGVGGEYWLIYIPWEQFKVLYKKGTQNNGQPIHITVDNAENIVLGPKPDAVYVVSGDFQRGVQVLAADGDIPDMPTNYHDLIVYRAIEKYGANSVAPEIFTRARLEGNRIMRALEMSQLPRMRFGGPLA